MQAEVETEGVPVNNIETAANMISEEELISMITYTATPGKPKKKKSDIKVDAVNVDEAKRRRVDDDTDGYDQPAAPRKQSSKVIKIKASKPRGSKVLAPIVARQGEPPISVLDYLKQAKITLPITDMAQMSPFFRNGAKRLLSQPRTRKGKKQTQQQP